MQCVTIADDPKHKKMNSIYISAPGKIIIHGEHSVVYGKPAIACSLNRRTYLRLQPTDNRQIAIILPDIGVDELWDLEEINQLQLPQDFDVKNPKPPSELYLCSLRKFLSVDNGNILMRDTALTAFLFIYHSLCRNRTSGFKIKVTSELAVGAGLGSSAGFSVCLSAALLLLNGLVSKPIAGDWKSDDLELINKWGFVLETLNHGKPSGIDNSVATYGKAIMFRAGCIERMDRMPSLQILLINTKVPRSTKELVSNVRKKYEKGSLSMTAVVDEAIVISNFSAIKYQSIVEPVLNSMEAIVEQSKEMFTKIYGGGCDEKSCYKVLQETIDMNQDLLRFLGVSHSSLEEVCKICLSCGLHAKLTGAGGGGCAFCLITPDTSRDDLKTLHEKLKECNFDCWETCIGGNGVMCHEADDCSFNSF